MSTILKNKDVNVPIEILNLWSKYEGQTTLAQVTELYNAALNTPAGDIVEIGSASGGTTIVLILAGQMIGKRVYSIDPYPVELEGKAVFYNPGLMESLKDKFKKNILNGKYENIIQFNEYLKDCIDKIPDNLSLVFIDGCHELSCIEQEYELLYPKVIRGGIIYIHDIDWNEGQLSKSVEGGPARFAELKGGENIHNMLKIIKS